MWESSVWMCFQLTEREREAGGDFYIYECVRQQHKSSTGLLHRGEPHQKCQSSAICSRLKLCNCNSVESFLTIRSMLEWIHSQTHAIHLHTWTNAHSSNKDTDESWDVELQWEMYVFVCLLACLFFINYLFRDCWDNVFFKASNKRVCFLIDICTMTEVFWKRRPNVCALQAACQLVSLATNILSYWVIITRSQQWHNQQVDLSCKLHFPR